MLLPPIQVGDGIRDCSCPVDFKKVPWLRQGCSYLHWDMEEMKVTPRKILKVQFDFKGYKVRPKMKGWLKSGGLTLKGLLLENYAQDISLRLYMVSFDRSEMKNLITSGLSIPFHFRLGAVTDRGVTVTF